MFRDLVPKVTSEINAVLDSVEEKQVAHLVRSIVGARCIVVQGAGRVGLACKGFAMRLGHLGKPAFSASDSTVPPIGKGDLLIIASSSGETQTVFDVALLGKKNGAHVAVITAAPHARMAELADSLVELTTQTKFGPADGRTSIQPMATLFEQCLQILFDILILILMNETNQKNDDLWARHSNLD